MTNDYYTENHNLHNTYGGKVYQSDFDGYISITDIAERIAYDQKFDKQCGRNIESRQRANLKIDLKSNK